MRRRPHMPMVLAASIILASSLAACNAMRSVAAKYPAPDIEAVYQPRVHLAEAHAERSPVIFVPGFGGSELRDHSGRVVWGARFTNDSLSFGRPEGLRVLALDVPAGFQALSREAAVAALFDLRDDDSTITEAMLFYRTEVVTEVEVSVYASPLVGLASGGYSLQPPSLAQRLGVPANPDGPPCFVFPFDWRRDLAGSSVDLERFLDRAESEVRELRRRRSGAAAAEAPVRFDVVAHSMAGLVLRYYMRYGARDVLSGEAWDDRRLPKVTWEGAERVDRAILVSPPNRGTTKALRNLANGDDDPFIPAYEPALVATWLSVPQMFPRPEPELLTDEAGRPVSLDYFDIATWREHHWGPYRPEQREVLRALFPGVADADQRLARIDSYLAASLTRAQRFVRLLDAPVPPPPRSTYHLFTGDADPTLARGLALRRNGGLHLVFEAPRDRLDEPGDGSVTRRSALADLRPSGSKKWLHSSVPWQSVLFLSDRHAGLLGNRVFQDNLLHLLLETPPTRLSAD